MNRSDLIDLKRINSVNMEFPLLFGASGGAGQGTANTKTYNSMAVVVNRGKRDGGASALDGRPRRRKAPQTHFDVCIVDVNEVRKGWAPRSSRNARNRIHERIRTNSPLKFERRGQRLTVKAWGDLGVNNLAQGTILAMSNYKLITNKFTNETEAWLGLDHEPSFLDVLYHETTKYVHLEPMIKQNYQELYRRVEAVAAWLKRSPYAQDRQCPSRKRQRGDTVYLSQANTQDVFLSGVIQNQSKPIQEVGFDEFENLVRQEGTRKLCGRRFVITGTRLLKTFPLGMPAQNLLAQWRPRALLPEMGQVQESSVRYREWEWALGQAEKAASREDGSKGDTASESANISLRLDSLAVEKLMVGIPAELAFLATSAQSDGEELLGCFKRWIVEILDALNTIREQGLCVSVLVRVLHHDDDDVFVPTRTRLALERIHSNIVDTETSVGTIVGMIS